MLTEVATIFRSMLVHYFPREGYGFKLSSSGKTIPEFHQSRNSSKRKWIYLPENLEAELFSPIGSRGYAYEHGLKGWICSYVKVLAYFRLFTNCTFTILFIKQNNSSGNYRVMKGYKMSMCYIRFKFA